MVSGDLIGSSANFRTLPTVLIQRETRTGTLLEGEFFGYESKNTCLHNELRKEHNFEEIIGNSPELLKLLERVQSTAPTDANVLIMGETGSGKELIARAIHSRSARRNSPLVKVNCGAIPAGLVESELSDMLRALSPAHPSAGSGDSNLPTTAPCSWTKWVSCRWRLRLSCSGSCRNRSSNLSEATAPSKSTYGSSPPRTVTLRKPFNQEGSARIFTTA